MGLLQEIVPNHAVLLPMRACMRVRVRVRVECQHAAFLRNVIPHAALHRKCDGSTRDITTQIVQFRGLLTPGHLSLVVLHRTGMLTRGASAVLDAIREGTCYPRDMPSVVRRCRRCAGTRIYRGTGSVQCECAVCACFSIMANACLNTCANTTHTIRA